MAGSEEMDKQPRLKADKMSRSKLPLAVLFRWRLRKENKSKEEKR